jgi:hypothetical protein
VHDFSTPLSSRLLFSFIYIDTSFLGNKARPEPNAHNLTTIFEHTVQKMWDPRHLSILSASMACYRDSFTFLFCWYTFRESGSCMFTEFNIDCWKFYIPHHGIAQHFLKSSNHSTQWSRLALFEGPDRAGVSLPSPEDGHRSSFWNIVFLSYLEIWTLHEVHKPSDSEWYSSSSGPFRFNNFL